jgi:hypothetical protein
MLDSHGAQAMSTAVRNAQTCCRADTSAGAPTVQCWIYLAASLDGFAASCHDAAASYTRCCLL